MPVKTSAHTRIDCITEKQLAFCSRGSVRRDTSSEGDWKRASYGDSKGCKLLIATLYIVQMSAITW